MNDTLQKKTEYYTEEHNKKKLWQKVVSILAAVVVFCTTYALILPAITWERSLICVLPEHHHSESCYETISVHAERVLMCDSVEHVHGTHCFNKDGKLECSLKEHMHTDECYEIVEEHIETVLVCNLEEHEHVAACFDAPPAEDKEFICGKIEHIHSEEQHCYYSDGSLCCTIPEHEHTFECRNGSNTDPETSAVSEKSIADVDTLVILSDVISVCDESEVGGHVYAEQAKHEKLLLKSSSSKMADRTLLMNNGDTESTGEPLQVEKYIPSRTADKKQAVVLEYKTKNAGENDPWIDVTTLPEEDMIPGDANLRLTIEFENVKISDLQATGYKMQFTLPEIMRNPAVSEQITSGGTSVGTLSIENGLCMLVFDENWVKRQQSSYEDSVINGDFWITSEIDLTEAEKMTPGTITVGDVNIFLNFDPEVIGKFSEVDIDKSDAVLGKDETSGKWYLTYTLTVEAGEDGCPDVSVRDIFKENNITGSYEILGAEKKTASDIAPVAITTDDITTVEIVNGESVNALKWPIGDMDPGDIYTLTYRVPLTEGYIGGRAGETIDNCATVVYDDTVEKTHDDSAFTPKTDVTITKTRPSGFSQIDTENGGYYIYQLEIKVPADTTYPLENVIIKDALDGTIAGKPATDSKVRKYMSYDTENDPDTSADDLAWCTLSKQTATEPLHDYHSEVVFPTDINEGFKYNESFSVNLGTLEPDTTVYFRYKVKIDPGVFTEIDNENGTINNTAGIILDGDEKPYKSSNRSDTITHKQWSRKSGGERNSDSLWITVDDGDDVYKYIADTDELEPSSPPADANDPSKVGFSVPENSYLYRIVANETGGWDISSASMTDEMQSAWMEYQGYVRVDAYSITSPVAGETDADVIANMAELTPAMTSWINVDHLKSFSFKPSDVFNDENGHPLTGDYAYLLTYYAKPETDDVLTNIVVGNNFEIKGKVATGDTPYDLLGVKVEADVVVQANTTFTAEKQPWYYAKTTDESINGFNNGALYWVIKVDGPVSVGTQFNDYTADTLSYYRSASVEGIYIGKLGEKNLTSYRNLASLKESVNANEDLMLESLQEDAYSIDYYRNADSNVIGDPTKVNCQRAVITMNQDVSLDPGESLYIIYRTDPDSVPTGNTGSKDYKNSLKTKLPKQTDYSDPQTVTETIHSQEYMYKEGGYLVECYDDGTGFKSTWNKSLPDYSGKPNIANAKTDGDPIDPGTYAFWYLRLDQWDNMNGRYRVIDRIPVGLTPELVALIAWDSNFTKNYGNHSVQIPLSELPEGNWTEHITVMNGSRVWSSSSGYSSAPSYTFYWYIDEQNNVLFELDNFNSQMTSGHDVQLLIGTRVSDPDVLMHGKKGEYNNTAEIYDADGVKIDQSSANVNVTKTTLEKTLNGKGVNPLPFAITANKMGEDLDPAVDTVYIVDTLSDNLRLDPSSIMVKSILTGQSLSWSVAVNGQTFTLSVPDSQPLLITYNAYLNELPDKEVTIWNDAYWQGSPPPTEHSVIIENYKYTSGGSAGADSPPKLEIIKNDADHAQITIPDAEFAVNRMIVDEDTGELTKDTTFSELTGSTNENGRLLFSDGDLEVNTVYCITETNAPFGYLRDKNPHYFIVAKKTEQPKNDENGDPVMDKNGNPVLEEVYPAFMNKLNTANPNLSSYVGLQYYEVDSKYSINIYDVCVVVELPATGGTGTIPIYAFGILLVSGSVICSCILRNKEKKRNE